MRGVDAAVIGARARVLYPSVVARKLGAASAGESSEARAFNKIHLAKSSPSAEKQRRSH